jgi:UDPglucose 6-dehydrogenase
MKTAIIGTGYVGLTTGVCLAELGHQVVCHDIDGDRIGLLKQSASPIFEPGLQDLIRRNMEEQRLQFTTDLAFAVGECELVFVAVNTPPDASGHVDLSFLFRAVRTVVPLLMPGATLVIKSTVIAGTADRVETMLHDELSRADLHIASNPEFLREGSAVADFLNPDRIVLGANDPLSVDRLQNLFAPLISKGVSLLVTERVNAELIKYAANALLAVKIGFINNIADLCEVVGGRIDDVSHGLGLDRRIGGSFLQPGPGFGGSCFPKDTRALAACGRETGAPQPLVETLIRENELRKTMLAQRILDTLAPSAATRVAVFGTAFKADTDDMRDAAALTLIPQLQAAGVRVAAHDPQAQAMGRQLLTDVEWHDTYLSAARGADAVVILTEWESYRALDLAQLARQMRGRHLFDFRNLFDADRVTRHGLHYASLGRPPARAATAASLAQAAE